MASGKSPARSARLAPEKRGVSRSSRTLGAGCDGRGRCTRRVHASRTVKLCGSDASTLASTRANASHCTGMVTKTPITRKSTKEPVKTIRAGKAGNIRQTCGDLSACFIFARGTAGELDHPAFPAPSHARAGCAKLGQLMSRGCEAVSACHSGMRAKRADPKSWCRRNAGRDRFRIDAFASSGMTKEKWGSSQRRCREPKVCILCIAAIGAFTTLLRGNGLSAAFSLIRCGRARKVWKAAGSPARFPNEMRAGRTHE